MANFMEMIYLQDMVVRRAVDDRLYFIQAGPDPEQQHTTESVVYARDPLQPIAQVLDSLKVIPSVPNSNSVVITAGWFYCQGLLYSFPGAPDLPIHLSLHTTSTILVGLKIDRILNTVTPYVNVEHGKLPQILPDVVPLALVQVRAGATEILSDDIVDIRPFLHYDTASPADKKEIYIACLGPHEGISFSRQPYHSGTPQLQVWQVVDKAQAGYVVSHDYRKPEGYDENEEGVFAPFTALHQSEYLAYDDTLDGVSLRKLVTRQPIELFDRDDGTVFVDPNGGATWPGTKDQPVATLAQAVDIARVKPEITTIFLSEGVYVVTTALLFPRPLALIGADPDKVIIRISQNGYFRVEDAVTFTTKLAFYTITLQFAGEIPDYANATLEYNVWIQANYVAFLNCVFRIIQGASPCAPLVRGLTDMFFSNCIFHNPYPNLEGAEIYPGPVVDFRGVQNSIYIGPWDTVKIESSDNIDTDEQEPGLENMATYNYRPLVGSPCIDAGSTAEVGLDVDGSLPDIGLYGGKYASMADIVRYPLQQLAVFRYPLQTLFAPVLGKLKNVAVEANIPANTEIYAAISFNGGKDWVSWDEATVGWKGTALATLHETGNTLVYLQTKLQNIDLTEYSGEVVLALGLYTQVVNRAPGVRTMRFTWEVSKEALTLYPLEKLDILVDGPAVMVRNATDEQVRDLVIVVR